jgi:hypothetical protein
MVSLSNIQLKKELVYTPFPQDEKFYKLPAGRLASPHNM